MASSEFKRLLRGDHLSSMVTPESCLSSRRTFLQMGGAAAGLQFAGGLGLGAGLVSGAEAAIGQSPTARPLAAKAAAPGLSIMDRVADVADATGYNNFYEFGLEKSDPARYAPRMLKVRPWQVSIEGLVKRPQVVGIDDLAKIAPMEERIYRLRCVEGWSMVIPWIGYSFSQLISRVEPLGTAKFVEFVTLADAKQMPGLSARVLRWPYHEGLRLDEAQHPLTLLTFGMYGHTLPEQNGAPIRLVVPWKYGFKSIKSIVAIRFVAEQPSTSWSQSAPQEYGFYSNVNPDVAHPRWSQASERVLGVGNRLFAPRRATERFNGYESLVASLYQGLDLKRFY